MRRFEPPCSAALGKVSLAVWAAVLMMVVIFGASSVWAQDESPDEGDSVVDTEIDFGAIDDLLAQDEEVWSDSVEPSYDPGARRDPFRSLLTTTSLNVEVVRERPVGPGGLLIDEIELQGIFILGEGPVVQVMSASEETSYLLRPGDQLWDGDVVSISINEVTFKQSVDDPTALKPFREVVKRLNP